MEGLALLGHRVACLCTAEIRLKPGVAWKRVGKADFSNYKVFNGGVYPARYGQGGVGSRTPLRDVYCGRALRDAVCDVLVAEQPEVVSIQSLFGLPFELINELCSRRIPVVFTAHDHFAICPTAHLFSADGKPCRLPATALTCHICCRTSPSYSAFWLCAHLSRLADGLKSGSWMRVQVQRFRNVIKRLDQHMLHAISNPHAYSIRRSAAIHLLKRLDVLHCISRRQAGIFKEMCGLLDNLRVLPLVPPTIKALKPVARLRSRSEKIVFTALNIVGPHKGSKLLQDVFEGLSRVGSHHELHVYGHCNAELQIPSVFYHGRYHERDLDTIASATDFCIVPSVCEETLGFVGLEMLARGVPLIVSNRAGVAEFVKQGENGYIFDPGSPESLMRVVECIVKKCCNHQLRGLQVGRGLMVTFEQHLKQMENLFREAFKNEAI